MITHLVKSVEYEALKNTWENFLDKNPLPVELTAKAWTIEYDSAFPLIKDSEGRKFQINFSDREYHKIKSGISTEPLSKALGAGKAGLSVLDLTAGLAQDAFFLMQLGYNVWALERNPLIYLALKNAWSYLSETDQKKINFQFTDALSCLDDLQSKRDSLANSLTNSAGNTTFDVVYYDPMFPQKRSKSALPKQEMVMFKNLVGEDLDINKILSQFVRSKLFKRVVVKRPLKSDPILFENSELVKPVGSIKGKVVRYDIY